MLQQLGGSEAGFAAPMSQPPRLMQTTTTSKVSGDADMLQQLGGNETSFVASMSQPPKLTQTAPTSKVSGDADMPGGNETRFAAPMSQPRSMATIENAPVIGEAPASAQPGESPQAQSQRLICPGILERRNHKVEEEGWRIESRTSFEGKVEEAQQVGSRVGLATCSQVVQPQVKMPWLDSAVACTESPSEREHRPIAHGVRQGTRDQARPPDHLEVSDPVAQPRPECPEDSALLKLISQLTHDKARREDVLIKAKDEMSRLKLLLSLGTERRRCHRCDLQICSLRNLLRCLVQLGELVEQGEVEQLEGPELLSSVGQVLNSVAHVDPQLAELALCLGDLETQ